MKNITISLIITCFIAAGCNQAATVNMADFGLTASTPENAAEKLREAFDYCRELGKPVRLVLEKGCYEIDLGQKPGQMAFLFGISSMEDFTFDGGGSELYFKGLSGLALATCSKRVSLENFTMDWRRPYITEAEVTDMTPERLILRIDPQKYPYRIAGGHVRYLCDDGEYDVVKDSYCNWLSPEGKIIPGTADDYDLYRTLNGPVKVLDDGRLEFGGKFQYSVPAGSRLLIYHVRYKTPWCRSFMTEGLRLENITIRHCTGCGLIADCCTDITIRDVDYIPADGRVFTGVADAFHITHASGKVEMSGCDINGQGDDALNVHGRYYRITGLSPDLKTMQCSTRSHVPLITAGDSVWFVCQGEMKRSEKYAVKSFTNASQDGSVWKMELEKPLDHDLAGLEIYAENATRNPEIHIHDNHFGSGNRARGILVTSPRKTVIEDNLFESSGAAILIEGDLNYWYESGGVSDVLIRRNVFSHCRTSPWGAAVIALTPSTSVPGYHSGVIVTENQFILDPGAEPLFSVDSSAVRFASDNMLYRVSSGQSL